MGKCWENCVGTGCKTGNDLGKMWEPPGKDPGVMWEYFGKTMGTSWDRYGNGWRKVRAPVKQAKARSI